MGLAIGLDMKLGGIEKSSAAVFTPASLFPAAGAWYDPSDLSSMFQDSAGTTPAAVNSPVGKLLDKSGNSNHLIQATAGSRPILKQSGSLFWLEFDGISQCMRGALGVTVTQPFHRVSGVSQISWTSGDQIFDGGANNQAILLQNGVTPQIAVAAGAAVACSNANLVIGTPGVITEALNGASSSITVNNGTAATGSPGTNSLTGVALAITGVSNAGFGNIRMYGLVIRGSLTGPQLASLKTYMGNKVGLSL